MNLCFLNCYLSKLILWDMNNQNIERTQCIYVQSDIRVENGPDNISKTWTREWISVSLTGFGFRRLLLMESRIPTLPGTSFYSLVLYLSSIRSWKCSFVVLFLSLSTVVGFCLYCPDHSLPEYHSEHRYTVFVLCFWLFISHKINFDR
jgi:hypothetical protein